jgi:hypothetical protein
MASIIHDNNAPYYQRYKALLEKHPSLPPNMGKRWTEAEWDKLVSELQSHTLTWDIAATHGRTVRAIEAAIFKLAGDKTMLGCPIEEIMELTGLSGEEIHKATMKCVKQQAALDDWKGDRTAEMDEYAITRYLQGGNRDVGLLSSNPYLTPKHLEDNLGLNWDWAEISRNYNITPEFVEAHHSKPWDWDELGRNPRTWDEGTTCGALTALTKDEDENANKGVVYDVEESEIESDAEGGEFWHRTMKDRDECIKTARDVALRNEDAHCSAQDLRSTCGALTALINKIYDEHEDPISDDDDDDDDEDEGDLLKYLQGVVYDMFDYVDEGSDSVNPMLFGVRVPSNSLGRVRNGTVSRGASGYCVSFTIESE